MRLAPDVGDAECNARLIFEKYRYLDFRVSHQVTKDQMLLFGKLNVGVRWVVRQATRYFHIRKQANACPVNLRASSGLPISGINIIITLRFEGALRQDESRGDRQTPRLA